MAFCRLVFPLLVLSVVNALECPMYIWGDLPETSYKAGPLETVDTLECSDFLSQELSDNPLTLVFIEETLSSEDLSHKDDNGETSYPYLMSKLSKAIYLPSVEDPLRALKEVAGDPTQIVLTDKLGLSENINYDSSESSNFIFIQLRDAREGESRADFLKRHDMFIKQTIANIKSLSDRSVVGIYTSQYPSWITSESHSRVRRAVRANQYYVNGLRFNAEAINLKSSNETVVLSAPVRSNSNMTNDELMASFNFEKDTSLALGFTLKGGYWFFEKVVLTVGSMTETLNPSGEEVYAFEGFSYRCAQNVRFTSANNSRDYTVTFQNLKVQPFFKDTNETTPYGESLDCVGFFSAPIWAGLFVVFIMLMITFYGIMMMMDIRTMDRFDDPKGKTITINAVE